MAAPTLGEHWQEILSSLEKGWDSYGANPISQAAIDTVDSFSIVPCHHGGIQLEVHKDGIDLEIEIGPEGNIQSAMLILEKR